MALIKPLKGKAPISGKNVYLAENATIIADNCFISINTVIRKVVHYLMLVKTQTYRILW